jgi:hypothetical protein
MSWPQKMGLLEKDVDGLIAARRCFAIPVGTSVQVMGANEKV